MPLMHDFTVTVEVGVSQQNIPYPYVVEQGDELAGSGVTAAVLARVFPSTDLSAATDGIADGLYDWENTDPLPLALFDAARVDFSLRRLVHYTGSDWRHVQPWILLTNYHRYVDQFIVHGLEQLRKDPRFVRMVLPGNVIIEKSMDHGEASAIAAGRGLAPLPDAGLSPDRQRRSRRDPGQHRRRPVQRQEHHRPPGGAASALLADDRSLRRLASVADHWRLRAGPRLHAPRRDSRPGGAAEHSDPGPGRSADWPCNKRRPTSPARRATN